MKSRALLVVYWLILLAATAAAGVWLARLLRGEQRRIASDRRAALEQLARRTADDLALIVEDARDSLLDSLAALPPDRLPAALDTLVQTHPLVRNAFVWSRDRALVYPSAAAGLSAEQAGFIRRYDRLFSNPQDWPVAAAPPDAAPIPRAEVRQLGKTAAQAAAPAAALERGWLPWFWEDQLDLLLWVATPDRATRYGVEVEMHALLSRIAAALPAPPDGQVFALRDANGRTFAQRGARDIAGGAAPAVSVGMGAALPHWTLAVYPAPGEAAAGGRALGLTAGAVVGVLLLAILSAGSLLLWQARRSAREARQKTSFVSNVSHELKTPLTTIRMYADLLAEGRIATEEKRAHYLDVIARESGRLTRLVNQVLDFSRLDQGRQTYRPAPLDLAELLRELLAGQGDRLRAAGMILRAELPESPAPATADRDALEQAVLNLLDNAVKYAAGGGLVRVALAREGAHWAVSVTDAGPGIPPAQRRKLFRQFHRADDSLTARTPGFGLGLNISRRLIEDQGGRLTFEPAPGGGARFILRLPADGAGGHQPSETLP